MHWTPGKVALLLGAIAGGICLFVGILVFQATVAFWTTETLEMFNTLSYGGVQTGQYPLSIYARWLQKFFTFPRRRGSLASVTTSPREADPGGAERPAAPLTP